MSDTVSICLMLGIAFSPEQLNACLYLERHGQKFCVDFGYDNAIEKARAHWLKSIEKRH